VAVAVVAQAVLPIEAVAEAVE